MTFGSYAREGETANKFLYNDGSERQDDLGLDIDLLKYRSFDPSIGRMMQIDPKAEEEELISFTPYNYSFNNPIRYNDPEGDCPPWVCGALLGAGVEYVTQATVNLATGQNLEDALFNNIDFADVGVAALEGGITGGGSVIRRLAVTGTAEVVKASIDGFGSGEADIVGTEGSNKDLSTVVIESTVNTAFSFGSSSTSNALVESSSDQALRSATSDVTAASKNLNKSIKTTSAGDVRTKAALPKQAFNNLNAAQTNLGIKQVLNNTVGQLNSNVTTSSVDIVSGLSSMGFAEGAKELYK